jgi:beta-phosphoglucomutase-like phosphatase (HAD superfamily)
VDGLIAKALQLKGKPEPDAFLTCAKVLGVEPERAIVVEDAANGVEAGVKGNFGLVVGIGKSITKTTTKQAHSDCSTQQTEETTEKDCWKLEHTLSLRTFDNWVFGH